MHIYLPGRSASSAPVPQNSKPRRRYSANAWSCLRGVIDREHRALEIADPRSPRIRPTLALLQQEGSR
jgi:hypothetical protein